MALSLVFAGGSYACGRVWADGTCLRAPGAAEGRWMVCQVPAPDVCRTCRSDDEHIDHVVTHAPQVADLDDNTRWPLREILFGPQQVRRG